MLVVNFLSRSPLSIQGLALCKELLSILVYGVNDSGGFPADRSLIDAIDELNISDDVGELSEAAYSSPPFLCAHCKLTHEAEPALCAHAIPGLSGPQADGCERRFDRVRRAEMLPARGREVVEVSDHDVPGHCPFTTPVIEDDSCLFHRQLECSLHLPSKDSHRSTIAFRG